jgi:hypothetical protein
MNMLLTEAVTTAVAGVEARDQAVAELALTYARAIDAGVEDLSKVGPALLAALEALQLSPRARKAVKIDDKPGANPLDELANARARKSRAETVDAGAS